MSSSSSSSRRRGARQQTQLGFPRRRLDHSPSSPLWVGRSYGAGVGLCACVSVCSQQARGRRRMSSGVCVRQRYNLIRQVPTDANPLRNAALDFA